MEGEEWGSVGFGGIVASGFSGLFWSFCFQVSFLPSCF